jgi:hypothetical protein
MLPSSSPPSSPYLLPLPPYAYASSEAFIKQDFSLDLSTSSEVPNLLSSNTTQQASVSIYFIHRVVCDFWLGF